MEKQKTLMRLFSGDKQLPTLPVLYGQLNQMLDNPFTSNRKISALIMKDQSMVTKILKLSNSAMYSKRQEITSLSNAITFLGTAILRNLILQISMVRLFDVNDEDIPDFSIDTFWEHSLGTAYFTDVLVKKLDLTPNDDYYICGLLHDIGKLVIYQFYPEDFKTIVKKQINENLTDAQAEIDVLGVDHVDIGTFLAEKWKFKKDIIGAIRDHHKAAPSMSIHAAIVRISNLFTKAAGLCFPWDHHVIDIVGDPAWEILVSSKKEPVDIERLTFEISDETQDIKESVKELLSKKKQ